MKKIIFVYSFLFFYAFVFCNENPSTLIKRTVLIFPFINKNNIEKYDYLKDTILNALNSELIRTNQFNFTNPGSVEIVLKNEKISGDYFDKVQLIENVANKLKADVVVLGQYIIIEDEIMIQLKAIDVFTGEIAATANVKGELGVDIFRVIDESVKSISDKMAMKLKAVEKTYFKEMTKLLDQQRIQNLKNSIGPVNIAGITLISTGTLFFLTGLPIFIYDLAGYSTTYIEMNRKYNNDEISYSVLYSSYQIYLGLFVSGLVVAGTGIILGLSGIPLIIYKNKKNQTISLNLKYDFNDNGLDLFLRIRL